MKKLVIIILILLSPLMLAAQKTLTASGSYTFNAPSNISLDLAKSIALERAKNEIIADNFGTVVGVNNYTEVSNIDGKSSVKYLSLGESEVRGEWIETIGKPVYTVKYEQNFQVVTVSVKGTIRELVASKVNFGAKVLRNGIEDRFESDSFKDGDDIYISFESPISGYLAIYLYDQEGISRLLPMPSSNEGSYMIPGGDKQVFFKQIIRQQIPSSGTTVETTKSIYHLVSSSESELNRIYIVFSPNKFTHPNDNVGSQVDLPPSLPFETFQKWLSRSRKQDIEMSVLEQDIIISK